MHKISYSDFLELLGDPETRSDDINRYVIVVPGKTGFDFLVKPNPEYVEMTPLETELESAMSIGNGAARFGRSLRFSRSLKKYPDRPVLVTEGDSWLQFPLLIDETIDHLSDTYNICSLGAAGDTLQNILYGPRKKGGFEFLDQLIKHRSRVNAFLFSAAGNDIIGSDPKTGEPMLTRLLHKYNGDNSDVTGHIDAEAVRAQIAALESGYREMVSTVRSINGLQSLPIIIHGYDVPFPYPFGSSDRRNPSYAENDQWLGKAFDAKQIQKPDLRRSILKVLIDELYAMLSRVADPTHDRHVHVVDCRGSLPRLEDWNDEIHGTSAGFQSVAKCFDEVLKDVIKQVLR
jgi:hypothetical protein